MIVDRFTSAKISSNLDERTLATLAILATDERRVILSNVVTFSGLDCNKNVPFTSPLTNHCLLHAVY